MLEVNQATLQHRIENVHLRCERGQCWHILGKNGAGKSSLLEMLAGLTHAHRGEVLVNDINIHRASIAHLASFRAFLQQVPSSEFDITGKQLLEFYTSTTQIPDQIEAVLSVKSLINTPLNRLSGGQQQRFHLARCFIQVWPSILSGNGLIILDEPCQHLDIDYQERLLNMLKTLSDLGNTVVLTSHDINQSARYASHIAWVKQHRLIAHGTVDELMTLANIQSVYDCAFDVIKIANGLTPFYAPKPPSL